MKHILIIANTYYQMEVALQLKNTLFINDFVELLLTDRSKGMGKIVGAIRKHKLFDNCQFVRSKEYESGLNNIDKIYNCFEIALGKDNKYNFFLDNIQSWVVDEFVFFNLDLETDGLFSILYRNNQNITVSRFEEGFLSYSYDISPRKIRKILACLNRILKNPILYKRTQIFYCFYPNIFNGNAKAKKIPLINNQSSTSKELKLIFRPNLKLYADYKYIFFTSVYDFEGGQPVGEYELVSKIADIVGKDNLLLKTHPRDTRTIYTDNGFNVDKNSLIPWEAIQLSGDFSDKVFMTINSGSVLSGSTMSEKPVRTYYMYKLCDISRNESCKKNVRDIESLLQNEEMKDVLKTVHIAEKLEDVL